MEASNKPHVSGKDRRTQLARIAYRHIAERGFEGLRLGDVAKEAGINNATLLYHFPNKEALIQAVLDLMLSEYLAIEEPRPAAGTASALEELRIEFVEARSSLHKGTEHFIVFTELLLRSRREPAIAPLLERLNSRWRDHMVGIIERGISEGIFRRDLDPMIAATAIMAQVSGIYYQVLSQNVPGLGDQLFDLLEAQTVTWFTGEGKNPQI